MNIINNDYIYTTFNDLKLGTVFKREDGSYSHIYLKINGVCDPTPTTTLGEVFNAIDLEATNAAPCCIPTTTLVRAYPDAHLVLYKEEDGING